MRLVALAFLTFLLIQASIQHSIAPRFTNGRLTFRNQFPFIISLQFGSPIENLFAHVCTGAAIHPEWIVTTGMCVKKVAGRISRSRAKIGMHYTDEQSNLVQTIQLIARAAYEQYQLASRSQANNIGLIKVEAINGLVLLIIPQPDPSLRSREVTMIGWVRSSEGDEGPVRDVMQFLDVILLDSLQCMARFPELRNAVPLDNSHFCVYLPDTSITLAAGDLGGPIVRYVNDRPNLIGLISWGFNSPGDVITPIICTNVTHFKGWIDGKRSLQQMPDDDSESEDMPIHFMDPR